MIKIEIDDRYVAFACHGGTPIEYRQRFQRDFFEDVAKIWNGLEDLGTLDTLALYSMVYMLAKTADSTINDDMLAWYTSFKAFPILSVIAELRGLIGANLFMQKKTQPTETESR